MINKNFDLDGLLNDRDNIIEMLNKETDIGCVLISINYLELCIRYLILDKFKEDTSEIDIIFELNGSLKTYYNKFHLANKLGLLKIGFSDDLRILGEIRNLFAHSHKGLSFKDEIIVSKCNELMSCRNSLTPFELKTDDTSEDVIYQNSKSKFILTFLNIIDDILAGGLLSRIMKM